MEPKEDFQVIIDPSVNERMAEHFEFLSRVSEEAANLLLDKLIEDMRSLEEDPYRFPEYNKPYLPVGKYRRKVSDEKYSIIFEIDGRYIYVDDIMDNRQDDDKSLLWQPI